MIIDSSLFSIPLEPENDYSDGTLLLPFDLYVYCRTNEQEGNYNEKRKKSLKYDTIRKTERFYKMRGGGACAKRELVR
jgi:hypothetical protein